MTASGSRTSKREACSRSVPRGQGEAYQAAEPRSHLDAAPVVRMMNVQFELRGVGGILGEVGVAHPVGPPVARFDDDSRTGFGFKHPPDIGEKTGWDLVE